MAIDFKRDSEVLKALGHPIRLKIVTGLLESDRCNVNKIVEQLKIPQSTVSQHLANLRHAGVLMPKKDGVKICYRVADKRIAGIVKALLLKRPA
jgi:predicted transcriptional regulator